MVELVVTLVFGILHGVENLVGFIIPYAGPVLESFLRFVTG